ncbi:MAG: signal peptidase II [Gammaproteobacteria bacterium]
MRKLGCVLIIVATLLLDLLSKMWVSHVFYVGEVLPVLPSFNVTLAHNTGAAFSFLAHESGWQRYFLSGLAIVMSIIFSVWLFRTPVKHHWTRVGLSLIIGGAIGNVIDRLQYGYVIDFLDFFVGVHHWPAFNVADSAICIGTGLLLMGMKES